MDSCASDRELEFQTDRDKLKLERTGVSAIGFDPAHVSYPKPAAAFYEVTLSDGFELVSQGHGSCKDQSKRPHDSALG